MSKLLWDQGISVGEDYSTSDNPNAILAYAIAWEWDDDGSPMGDQIAYVAGILPPNYPVPAVLGQCIVEDKYLKNGLELSINIVAPDK